VIKGSFLKAQSERSRAQNKTTPFLRRLVLSVVDRVAREHYAAAYPMKCLQTSSAVLRLLERLGINGVLCEGALCAALVHEDRTADGWGGFWGSNHHVWAMSQFGEIIDLSLSQIHRHPAIRRTDRLAPPAMWWNGDARGLSAIRHLPDNFFLRIGFNDEAGAADLALFEERVTQAFDQTILAKQVGDIAFAPLLENIDGAQALFERGDAWLKGAVALEQSGAPLPAWIVERQSALEAAARAGVAPASVLRGRPFRNET
jgi:hypothetical protein